MEEVKFRAWDVMYRRWVQWEDLKEYKINTISEGVENRIWVQYTGLKDRNNVEIYEGDLCMDYLGNVHQIEKSSFTDDNSGICGYGYVFSSREIFESLEVIGSIYNNTR